MPRLTWQTKQRDVGHAHRLRPSADRVAWPDYAIHSAAEDHWVTQIWLEIHTTIGSYFFNSSGQLRKSVMGIDVVSSMKVLTRNR